MWDSRKMCWGVGRGRGDVERGMRGRCRKVCWGVGKVRGDVGKGEVRKEMWGSVLHILSHTPPHSPHTLYHTSPLPTHLSLSPPTPQDISLHLPSHLFPQLP